MEDWNVEISPSSRSVCRECGKKIPMNVIRWRQKTPNFGRLENLFYHYDCGCGILEDIQDSVRDMMRQSSYDKEKYDKILEKLKAKND